jgi:hypothetical protein
MVVSVGVSVNGVVSAGVDVSVNGVVVAVAVVAEKYRVALLFAVGGVFLSLNPRLSEVL